MSTGKKLRRHYKVERLPAALRALVDRGLAEGKSYVGIAEEVTQAGHPLSETAIRHYCGTAGGRSTSVSSGSARNRRPWPWPCATPVRAMRRCWRASS